MIGAAEAPGEFSGPRERNIRVTMSKVDGRRSEQGMVTYISCTMDLGEWARLMRVKRAGTKEDGICSEECRDGGERITMDNEDIMPCSKLN